MHYENKGYANYGKRKLWTWLKVCIWWKLSYQSIKKCSQCKIWICASKICFICKYFLKMIIKRSFVKLFQMKAKKYLESNWSFKNKSKWPNHLPFLWQSPYIKRQMHACRHVEMLRIAYNVVSVSHSPDFNCSIDTPHIN